MGRRTTGCHQLMRLLATLNNARLAQAFIDYLALQAIDIEVKAIAPQQVELWVATENFAQAEAEFSQFVKNPHDKKYLNASWQRNSDSNPLSYQAKGPGLVSTWLGHGGWVLHGVVVLCLLVFASFYLGFGEPVYTALQFPDHDSLGNGQLWRWVTPALMHFSLLHIAFNLLWWWMLAGLLERHFGRFFLLAFTLLTAVISNYAQFVVSASNDFGGLSGVVYALIGFCWLQGKLRPQQPVGLKDGLFVFALVWLAIGYTGALWMNIANTAHLSGLLAGLAFAFVSVSAKR